MMVLGKEILGRMLLGREVLGRMVLGRMVRAKVILPPDIDDEPLILGRMVLGRMVLLRSFYPQTATTSLWCLWSPVSRPGWVGLPQRNRGHWWQAAAKRGSPRRAISQQLWRGGGKGHRMRESEWSLLGRRVGAIMQVFVLM